MMRMFGVKGVQAMFRLLLRAPTTSIMRHC